MYRPGRISQNFFNRPNLKILVQDYSRFSSDDFVRNSLKFYKLSIENACQNVFNVKETLQGLIKGSKFFRALQIGYEPTVSKNEAPSMFRVWARQCECVVAHRLRRGQQMFSLYSKLWEEKALKEFFHRFRQNVQRRSKNLLLGAVGISAYNWEANRIPDSLIKEHLNDFEYVYLLKEKTVCPPCRIKKKDTPKGPDVPPECDCCEREEADKMNSYDNWVIFIANDDLIVWRRPKLPGLYEYKVFGCYSDVTAEDFLNVQVDTNYRRKWDVTAVILEVLESDPIEESHTDILYWEMLWPSVFTNRDYVFTRKYIIDYPTQTILVVNKATDHPLRPKVSNKIRVDDYYSYMVIRPTKELAKPGIQFVLTYFDNPGINVPSSVTSWVAYRAMPDFLERLRQAAKRYKVYCAEAGVSGYCSINPPKSPADPEKSGVGSGGYRGDITDLTPAEILTSPSPMMQADRQRFWKHFQTSNLFS